MLDQRTQSCLVNVFTKKYAYDYPLRERLRGHLTVMLAAAME
jgi:hypothetical protein